MIQFGRRRARKRLARDLADLEAAERDLRETRERWPVILRAVATVEGHRDRNHISEHLGQIMRGGR